jgi:hypothetical protein
MKTSKIIGVLLVAAAFAVPVLSLPANASSQGDYMTMLAAQNMMGNPATAGLGAQAFANYAAQKGAYGGYGVPYGGSSYYAPSYTPAYAGYAPAYSGYAPAYSGYAPGYAAPAYGYGYPHHYWHHW